MYILICVKSEWPSFFVQSCCPLTFHRTLFGYVTEFINHAGWILKFYVLVPYEKSANPYFFPIPPTYNCGVMVLFQIFKHSLLDNISLKLYKLQPWYLAYLLRLKIKLPYSILKRIQINFVSYAPLLIFQFSTF